MRYALYSTLLVFSFAGAVIWATPERELGSQRSIEQLQERAFSERGKYEFIRKGDPRLPPTYEIHEYLTPKGVPGYQILWQENDEQHSKGFGPEAVERTFSSPLPEEWTSSTSTSFDFSPLYAWLSPLSAVANTHSTDLEAGSSQYFSITDAAQSGFDFTGDFSISMWIKRESAGLAGLVDKTANSNDVQWRFQSTGGNLLGLAVRNAAGTTAQVETNAPQVSTTGAWIHIVAVWDLSASDAEFYVGGSNVASTPDGTISDMRNTAGAVRVGARFVSSSPANFYDGLIDELLIYNVALDSTVAAALFTDPCNPSTTGLVSRYSFDNTAEDFQGSNDLTNNNSATFSTDVAFTCDEEVPVQDILWFD